MQKQLMVGLGGTGGWEVRWFLVRCLQEQAPKKNSGEELYGKVRVTIPSQSHNHIYVASACWAECLHFCKHRKIGRSAEWLDNSM